MFKSYFIIIVVSVFFLIGCVSGSRYPVTTNQYDEISNPNTINLYEKLINIKRIEESASAFEIRLWETFIKDSFPLTLKIFEPGSNTENTALYLFRSIDTNVIRGLQEVKENKVTYSLFSQKTEYTEGNATRLKSSADSIKSLIKTKKIDSLSFGKENAIYSNSISMLLLEIKMNQEVIRIFITNSDYRSWNNESFLILKRNMHIFLSMFDFPDAETKSESDKILKSMYRKYWGD